MRSPATRIPNCLAFALMVTGIGCSSHSQERERGEAAALRQLAPDGIQSNLTSFATRYVSATSDVYNRLLSSSNPDTRIFVQRQRLIAGLGAMGNAVNPRPIVGLMDMAVMVTLTRQSIEDPWTKDLLAPDDRALIIATLQAQETDIWNLAASYLTPDQLKELRALAARWRKEHPDQRYVGGARLADFPEAKSSNIPGQALANSVFNLLRLDPFSGLDPAVRQIAESRILAERVFL